MHLIEMYQVVGFALIFFATITISFLSSRVAKKILKDKTK